MPVPHPLRVAGAVLLAERTGAQGDFTGALGGLPGPLWRLGADATPRGRQLLPEVGARVDRAAFGQDLVVEVRARRPAGVAGDPDVRAALDLLPERDRD